METLAIPADTAVTTRTEVLSNEETDSAAQPVLRLRLNKPKSNKKVGWQQGTVDNEHMGKKKSKCCCIYKKPVAFGESSSEDDEDCENCFGHPEKRRKNRKPGGDDGGHNGNEPCEDHNQINSEN
ncbi:E3 ubiquitin-protein ligase PPP1R11 [Haematobia irritans]|uniref:E3 ubiquitin-protein ligase PPP1R11 n=1 Tax=Haematobia irritans TaxID=7368 RepID=UPI003F50CD00